jgi:hypothetical protein
MNEKQIKRNLEDRGLKIVDVARAMHKAFPSITRNSAEVMLRQLIAGQRWYPVYAEWLKQNYGITVDKPKWLMPVRERMRQAA